MLAVIATLCGQATNIEAGMGLGVLLAIVAFAVSYAKAPAVLLRRVRHSSMHIGLLHPT
jgi:hypothetical protein